MNGKHIRIPPELGVAKALSIKPDDIEDGNVETIGICYRCKKPIKNWDEGGLHNFSIKVDSYSYPFCKTTLLCSDCGWHIQQRILDFLNE